MHPFQVPVVVSLMSIDLVRIIEILSRALQSSVSLKSQVLLHIFYKISWCCSINSKTDNSVLYGGSLQKRKICWQKKMVMQSSSRFPCVDEDSHPVMMLS